MEKYINEHGKQCWAGVMPNTPFSDLEFAELEDQFEDNIQHVLHTNLGSLTVVDRMTGFGWRDVETGYRDPDGNFWLASGGYDVRHFDAETMQDAIDWVKQNANTCRG